MRAGDEPRLSAPARPDPLVVCVVLSYGRAADTWECLASLQRSTYPRMKTLLLNGDPGDEVVPAARNAFPDVEFKTLGENKGYAGNNNVGIDAALERGADWVFLLNDDTVVDPECVSTLVDAVRHVPGAGIAGPTIYHHQEPDIIQSAGGRISKSWQVTHIGRNEPERSQFRETSPVDWASGCALLVSRAVIEAVGALDERYFMYCEELEWCLRARRAGWTVVHVPRAKVWHKGVQSDYRPSPAVTYYTTRNLLLTLSLHRAPFRARVAQWLAILRTLAAWTVMPRWRHKAAHRGALWRGAVDYVRGHWGPMAG